MIGTTIGTTRARQNGTKSGTAKKPNAHKAARGRHENNRVTGTIRNPMKWLRSGTPHQPKSIPTHPADQAGKETAA